MGTQKTDPADGNSNVSRYVPLDGKRCQKPKKNVAVHWPPSTMPVWELLVGVSNPDNYPEPVHKK